MTYPPEWTKLSVTETPSPEVGGTGVPPPHRVPSHLSRRLFQIFSSAMAQAFEGEGLAGPQFAALVSIAAEPGIDQTRLGQSLGIDRTNIGLCVDQLTKIALVERRPDPGDRRTHRLWLTPRGSETRWRLHDKAIMAQDQVLSPLTEAEKVTLVRMLLRVVEANEVHARPGAGRRAPRRSNTGLRE